MIRRHDSSKSLLHQIARLSFLFGGGQVLACGLPLFFRSDIPPRGNSGLSELGGGQETIEAYEFAAN